MQRHVLHPPKRLGRIDEVDGQAMTSLQTCENGKKSKLSWIVTGTRVKEEWSVWTAHQAI